MKFLSNNFDDKKLNTFVLQKQVETMSQKSVKFYIIAGEASGDLHGSNLIKALKKQHDNIEFRGWGGDLMKDEGLHLTKHYKDLAFMGFTEVIMNLPTILGNIKFCKKDIEEYKPDAVIMIDYPGFNLRIAEHVKKLGIKVFYYVSPQIWAWKENRIHKIKRMVDKMYVILPFEKDYYKKHDFEVEFCGHPLLDAINLEPKKTIERERFLKENNLTDKPIIALLPGSREQEVKRMLKIMLSMVEKFPSYQFVIAGAPSLPLSFYQQVLPINIPILFGKTYELYLFAESGLVTSGTATLEAAIHRLPQVVCYKAGTISYHIAKRLVKIKYISLVNLIMDREVVTELIQKDFNKSKLQDELEKINIGGTSRENILSDYALLYDKLGGKGASEKIATSMLKSV